MTTHRAPDDVLLSEPDPWHAAPRRRHLGFWLTALPLAVIIGGIALFTLNVGQARSAGAPPPPVMAAEPDTLGLHGERAAALDSTGYGAQSGAGTAASTPAAGAPDTGPIFTADADWLSRTAAATGIPTRALAAYASAQLVMAQEQPQCRIGWNTLAGIGYIESGHGTHGGSAITADGWVTPRIVGVALNGNGVAAIRDTDGGAWDADTVWDRAVGPMQFIPSTWARWGADGNDDGTADPNHIDDAALAAARYLCESGPMDSADGWRAAVFSYNHLNVYVDDVAAAANAYAQRAAQ